MEYPQTFSHGLLYSVSPQDLPSLHLRDEERKDDFEWESEADQHRGNTISHFLVDLLKNTAAHWGIKRH
jgi:hypothetical protein